MAINDYYVYGYSDPTSCDPYFYIGMGRGRRLYHHLNKSNYERKNTRFYCKLRNMLEKGIEPEITKLVEDLSEEQAIDLEIKIIAQYGRLDTGTGCLCNHTDGGEGPTGYIHTEETKKRIKETLEINARGINTSYWNWKGRKHSIDARVKMSNFAVNRSKELRERLAKLNKENKGIAICRCDLLTGEILEIFESIRELDAKGYNRSAFNKAKRNGGNYLGYKWRELTKQEIDSLIKKEI